MFRGDKVKTVVIVTPQRHFSRRSGVVDIIECKNRPPSRSICWRRRANETNSTNATFYSTIWETKPLKWPSWLSVVSRNLGRNYCAKFCVDWSRVYSWQTPRKSLSTIDDLKFASLSLISYYCMSSYSVIVFWCFLRPSSAYTYLSLQLHRNC